jgi:hypothetical protein
MQITGSLVDWHMERSRADGVRQQWERVARYRKDPLRYLAGRRSIGAPAVEPWVPDGPVPEWVPPAPVVVEPSPADLVEMRREQNIAAIEDFCRDYRGQREALKERLNLVFQSQRMGLKVIRWQQWAS